MESSVFVTKLVCCHEIDVATGKMWHWHSVLMKEVSFQSSPRLSALVALTELRYLVSGALLLC